MSTIDISMFDLFREEVRTHADTLAAGLIALEAHPSDPALLEGLMRAAHSIKGAARIIGIDTAVRLAHVMEDALVAAQAGRVRLASEAIDTLLKGTDVLSGLASIGPDTIAAWENDNAGAVSALEPLFQAMAKGQSSVSRVSRPVAAGVALSGSDAGPFPPVPPFEPAVIPTSPFALAAEHSMLDLFREEIRGHLHTIVNALPTLASDPGASETLMEPLKQMSGAARLVRCNAIAMAAGSLGDFLRAARETKGKLSATALDWMRYTVAAVAGVTATGDDTFAAWVEATEPRLAQIAETFRSAAATPLTAEIPALSKPIAAQQTGTVETSSMLPSHAEAGVDGGESAREAAGQIPVTTARPELDPPIPQAKLNSSPAETVVRVTAQSLNRLMGLAGESLVQARWLPSFSTSLLKLKKQHALLANVLDSAFQAASGGLPHTQVAELIADARRQWSVCRQELNAKTGEFDDHAARAEDLNTRLYREVITSRMRPFRDGTHGFPRLVRDMARQLGKEAQLVILGERTEVDRDILERLESPLSHLIRNAVDHGLEAPEVRSAAGKRNVGTVTLEARHRAGMLHVTVADDGAGIDLARLRSKVVEKRLSAADIVSRLTESELLEFLFLPGFSTASNITEFSGRGVGLDVVQDTIRKVGGNVRITTAGSGTTFHLQLPLTLSVIRAVVVEVAGEPYAFPHTRIDRLLRVPRSSVRSIEHRQFVTVNGQNVGLVMAGQLLDITAATPASVDLPVVLLSDGSGEYGLIVDAFRGEQDLVVRPLDARLGKVPNLSAAAILDDGSPVLIVDVEDLLRSMDQYIQTGSLLRCETRSSGPARKKRVLVVDDSITVREVERQLLLHKGFEVAVAVDGVDGWNQVRAERYDLLVSDIDMPRMNGLQLVQAVRADERLRDLPVIIVSYKEREEDRMRGLEVGANAYLTKSSFHDNRFMEAVIDLIGPAE